MILGSHNSMTYLPVKKWYLSPFKFIAKCQSKTIEEQYNSGVRLFDLRISYTKSMFPEFRHGLIAFKGNVYDTIKWLSERPEPVTVRLTLETSKEDTVQEFLFIKDCSDFVSKYPSITFINGRRKFDWKQLYKFEKDPELVQMVSSMTGSKYDDWWPWLYAKLHNIENLEKYKDVDYLMIDFI